MAAQQDFIETIASLLVISREDVILDALNEGSTIVIGSVSAASQT